MRPLAYSPEIGDAICARLAEGQPLSAIVRDNPDMPAYHTVFKWLRENKEFAHNYAHAREAQADALSDEILMVSRQEPGRVVVESETGTRTSVDSAEVAHRRLLVDSLKWTAAKMKPKKYGDAAALELKGGDGGPIKIEVVRTTTAPGTLQPQQGDGDG